MRKNLPDWAEKLEHFVDRAIPYVFIVLTGIIVADLTGWGEKYHSAIVILDYVVLSFFVVDLFFKWFHTKTLYKFVKLYWIDLIAVFPFYLVFRIFIVGRDLLAAGEQTQKILHETALLREAKFLREAELLREGEFGVKFAKEGRFIRPILRFVRLVKARLYFIHGHFQSISEAHRKTHRE